MEEGTHGQRPGGEELCGFPRFPAVGKSRCPDRARKAVTSISLTNEKGTATAVARLAPHNVNTGTQSGGTGEGVLMVLPTPSIWPYRRGGSELKCVSLASVCPMNSPSAC